MTDPTPATAAQPAPVRTAAQIQADIAASRDRLAGTVDELTQRLSPQALVGDVTAKVRGAFVDDAGHVKVKPVAIGVGVIVGLVLLRRLVRR